MLRLARERSTRRMRGRRDRLRRLQASPRRPAAATARAVRQQLTGRRPPAPASRSQPSRCQRLLARRALTGMPTPAVWTLARRRRTWSTSPPQCLWRGWPRSRRSARSRSRSPPSRVPHWGQRSLSQQGTQHAQPQPGPLLLRSRACGSCWLTRTPSASARWRRALQRLPSRARRAAAVSRRGTHASERRANPLVPQLLPRGAGQAASGAWSCAQTKRREGHQPAPRRLPRRASTAAHGAAQTRARGAGWRYVSTAEQAPRMRAVWRRCSRATTTHTSRKCETGADARLRIP
jgi:hypothetical protein